MLRFLTLRTPFGLPTFLLLATGACFFAPPAFAGPVYDFTAGVAGTGPVAQTEALLLALRDCVPSQKYCWLHSMTFDSGKSIAHVQGSDSLPKSKAPLMLGVDLDVKARAREVASFNCFEGGFNVCVEHASGFSLSEGNGVWFAIYRGGGRQPSTFADSDSRLFAEATYNLSPEARETELIRAVVVCEMQNLVCAYDGEKVFGKMYVVRVRGVKPGVGRLPTRTLVTGVAMEWMAGGAEEALDRCRALGLLNCRFRSETTGVYAMEKIALAQGDAPPANSDPRPLYIQTLRARILDQHLFMAEVWLAWTVWDCQDRKTIDYSTGKTRPRYACAIRAVTNDGLRVQVVLERTKLVPGKSVLPPVADFAHPVVPGPNQVNEQQSRANALADCQAAGYPRCEFALAERDYTSPLWLIVRGSK